MSLLFDLRFAAIAFFVFSVVYVHFRGTVRHKWSRQLIDHSSLFAPINIWIYLFSGVGNKPFPDRSRFPELDLLKNNWKTIRNEGLSLIKEGEIKASTSYDDAAFNSFFRTGWKRYYLKWYGKQHESALKSCPETVRLLNQIPSIKAAMFASLPAGSHLGEHRDPYAGSLRYHLGLATPNNDDCNIVVDGITYSWRDGEDVVFDETFIHAAHNQTDENRLILFCDVERPTSNIIVRYYNKFFSRVFMSAAATGNQPGEPVGVVNKIFSTVEPLRQKIRLLKKSQPRLYKVIKVMWLLFIFFILFGLPFVIFGPAET